MTSIPRRPRPAEIVEVGLTHRAAIMSNRFDDAYDELLATLTELSSLLDRHDEHHWARWVARSHELIARGQAHGLDHLLGAFGGMGSLTEVGVHRSKGRTLTIEQVQAASERLQHLQSRAFSLATALRRELRRDG